MHPLILLIILKDASPAKILKKNDGSLASVRFALVIIFLNIYKASQQLGVGGGMAGRRRGEGSFPPISHKHPFYN